MSKFVVVKSCKLKFTFELTLWLSILIELIIIYFNLVAVNPLDVII